MVSEKVHTEDSQKMPKRLVRQTHSLTVLNFISQPLFWWSLSSDNSSSPLARRAFSLLHKQDRGEAASGRLGAEHSARHCDRYGTRQSERTGRPVLLAGEGRLSSLEHQQVGAQELSAAGQTGIQQISSEQVLRGRETFERTRVCVIQRDRGRITRIGQIKIRISVERWIQVVSRSELFSYVGLS